MARTVAWRSRIHAIREEVKGTAPQIWYSQHIAQLFNVSLPTAHRLVHTIGGLHQIGNVKFIQHSVLLEFLNDVIGSKDVTVAVQERRLAAGPAPSKAILTYTGGESHKFYTAQDLPDNIELTSGRLVILGDPQVIFDSLHILAQAMLNDLGTIQLWLEKSTSPCSIDDRSCDEELQEMRKELERLERRLSLPGAPDNL